jgi:site-specific DNA recombinase
MNGSPLVPTILYIRQSVTRETSESIATQIELCTEAAPRLGAEIIETLVEPPSTSGYRNRGRDRPKFLDLLDRIRNGEARAVMAYRSDRLSRGGGPGWAPMFDAFDAAGWDPDRAVLTPSGWMSEFEIGIRATMDREESKKLSGRMLDTRAREAREGKPRVGGHRPYGYSCSGVDPEACTVPECPHDGTMSIIPSEAAIVGEVADRVLAGESIWSLTKDLDARGVPTLTGAGWVPSVLTMILRKPRIAGLRAHNGTVVAEGAWPAILARDRWERLCLVLDNRQTAGGPRRNNSRSYLLVGYLFCGRCGAKLRSVQKQYGRRDRGSRATRVVTKRAYACRKGPALGGCGALTTVAEPVEDEVKQYVIGKLGDPKYRHQLVQLAQSEDNESTSLADRLADLEAQRDTLLDLYLDKKVAKATYERRYESLTETIEALHRKVFSRQSDLSLQHLPISVEELTALWAERDITFRRQLVDLVLDRVVVHPPPKKGPRFDPDRLEWHPKQR